MTAGVERVEEPVAAAKSRVDRRRCVAPATALSKLRLPSPEIEYEETLALPVFVVKRKRSSRVTTTQHAAVCVSGTEGLKAEIVPSTETSYDDTALWPAAPPKASDTYTRPLFPNANPNGVMPLDGCAARPVVVPLAPTAYVEIVFEAFSVTARILPVGFNEIWAGPTPAPLSGRVEPSMGNRRPNGPTRSR